MSPRLRDLVSLAVDGGRVVRVDGGQARRLAVQRGHLVFQGGQVALHALMLALKQYSYIIPTYEPLHLIIINCKNKNPTTLYCLPTAVALL